MYIIVETVDDKYMVCIPKGFDDGGPVSHIQVGPASGIAEAEWLRDKFIMADKYKASQGKQE